MTAVLINLSRMQNRLLVCFQFQKPYCGMVLTIRRICLFILFDIRENPGYNIDNTDQQNDRKEIM